MDPLHTYICAGTMFCGLPAIATGLIAIKIKSWKESVGEIETSLKRKQAIIQTSDGQQTIARYSIR